MTAYAVAPLHLATTLPFVVILDLVKHLAQACFFFIMEALVIPHSREL